MPSTEAVLDGLSVAKFVHTIDLCSAYFSIPLDPESTDLTAFATRRGQFKFLKMSPGLVNGSAPFNELIQLTFGSLLNSSVFAFLDDLAIPIQYQYQYIDFMSGTSSS